MGLHRGRPGDRRARDRRRRSGDPTSQGSERQGPQPARGPVRSARHLDRRPADRPSRRTPRATARRWPWRGSSKAWTPTTTSGRGSWPGGTGVRTGMRSIPRLPVRQLSFSRRRWSSSKLTAAPDRCRTPTFPTSPSARAADAARPELSRRTLLGAAAAGAAGFVVGRVAGPLFPSSSPEAPGSQVFASDGIGRLSVLRRPSSRGLHAAPGPPPLRGLRHARGNQPARTHEPLARLVGCSGVHDPGAADPSAGGPQKRPGRAAGRHGRSPGSAGELSDHHDRFGPRLFERDGVDRFDIARGTTT